MSSVDIELEPLPASVCAAGERISLFKFETIASLAILKAFLHSELRQYPREEFAVPPEEADFSANKLARNDKS